MQTFAALGHGHGAGRRLKGDVGLDEEGVAHWVDGHHLVGHVAVVEGEIEHHGWRAGRETLARAHGTVEQQRLPGA